MSKEKKEVGVSEALDEKKSNNLHVYRDENSAYLEFLSTGGVFRIQLDSDVARSVGTRLIQLADEIEK